MKRMKMETKIAITFFFMFIAGVVINGIYSVVSMNSNFFTFGVLEKGIFFALIYLFYIWIYTRRHKMLTLIGVNCIGLMSIFSTLSSFGVDNIRYSNWYGNYIILIIFCIVSAGIAAYQSEKLLEEENETIESNQRALIREEIENAKREEH